MAKKLVIVESPAKAKTISKYLGKDFEVLSSMGHIRDLEKEGMGIDIDHGFMPNYIVSKDKKNIVKKLKEEVKRVEEVWLATDGDREGEAISWHLCEVLGLDPKTTKRITFNEITKPTIQKAIQDPRTVDMDLVKAQQARRILDRLVGFEVSPVLWRKLSGKSLSAGRVQSVAVKLLAEREREINKFKSESKFKIEGYFKTEESKDKSQTFKAEGYSFENGKTIESSSDAKEISAYEFLEKCQNATFTVKEVKVRPGKKTSAPPFTTSTLQQEAGRKLGYSVSRTMRLAQQLYESGLISYMRTDSVNLSETALNNAKEVILKDYGEKYHHSKQYHTKSKGAQEAHEAIRPTDLNVRGVSDSQTQSLYNLIWKRTIASQMSDAVTEKTTAEIGISTIKAGSAPYDHLTARGEVIVFDGFLKVYREGRDDDEEKEDGILLPHLDEGQILDLVHLDATERFNRPPARFTEATLVKRLEELGIGRPSTYAPTISTIQNRGYVEKKNSPGHLRSYQVLQLKDNGIRELSLKENTGVEKNKLFPTDLGLVVTDFLNDHFREIMDYGFTADIENKFDDIAAGHKEWDKMVSDFYTPFHQAVDDTLENAGRVKGEHELGADPESGKPVIARLGRYGAMVQIGSTEDTEKPRFASLKPGQSIETITLKEALELFKVPFSLEDYEGEEVVVGIGRFGPYIKWGSKFISLPKGEDPLTVDQERAVELIEEKKKADAPVFVYKEIPVTKGQGRFGPYLKYGDLYINVPKRYDFNNLSPQEIEELVEAKIEKEANRYIKRWEKEKIAIENGRWGPFIRVGKSSVKLGRKKDGEKFTKEELEALSLEEVKEMIEASDPGLLKKKSTVKKVKRAASGKPTARKKKN